MPALFFSSLDERGSFTGWFSSFHLRKQMPGYASDIDQKRTSSNDHRYTFPQGISRAFCCLLPSRRLARFKREQHQTEPDELQEHPMQRGLIRERSREQRGASLLLL